MTYAYPCNRKSCNEKVEGGKIFLHWKSSCCHKCPNPSCRDHGECNCFERLIEQRRKYMEEMMNSPEWIENVLPKITENIEELEDNSDKDRKNSYSSVNSNLVKVDMDGMASIDNTIEENEGVE